MKKVSDRVRMKSRLSRRVWHRPKQARQLTVADAIFAIEEMLVLEHHPGRPCQGCREAMALLKRLKAHLDLTAHSSDLLWDALAGKRVMQFYKVHRATKG